MKCHYLLPILASLSSLAQEKPTPTSYRLHFRIQESQPASKPSDSVYDLIIQSRSHGKINASRRIPYYSSSKSEAKEVHSVALGNIIECNAHEQDAGVQLNCSFESSFVTPVHMAEPRPAGFLPVTISRQVSTTAWVPLGSEIQIAGLDDPASKSRLEIFVTAARAQ
jgi:hypothetical protein